MRRYVAAGGGVVGEETTEKEAAAGVSGDSKPPYGCAVASDMRGLEPAPVALNEEAGQQSPLLACFFEAIWGRSVSLTGRTPLRGNGETSGSQRRTRTARTPLTNQSGNR